VRGGGRTEKGVEGGMKVGGRGEEVGSEEGVGGGGGKMVKGQWRDGLEKRRVE